MITSCSNTAQTTGTVTSENSGQTVTSGNSTQAAAPGSSVQTTTTGSTGTTSSSSTTQSSGGSQTQTTQAASTPQYGGTLTLAMTSDPLWNLFSLGPAAPQLLTNQRLWDGSWAMGPAGGYGEDKTDWGQSTQIPSLNTGILATDSNWVVSANGSDITTTFTIRQGVYYAQPDTEAGRLVGGREMTTDDVVWNYNQRIHNTNAMNYQLFPTMRYPTAVKTGPWTIQITHKFADALASVNNREGSSDVIFPPELYDKYGYNACTDWQYSVGTGPYMMKDYVSGNMVDLVRNPNYWMTDPVGPGKGNQLPYVSEIKYLIIQDTSTSQAALRTGKLDRMAAVTPQDKDSLIQEAPDMITAARGSWQNNSFYMNTLEAPFNDINVRKALMMATDFNSINENLFNGVGEIISWPYFEVGGYEPLVVSTSDSDCPDSVKQLYTYNPDEAKKLLADAGYPNVRRMPTITRQLQQCGHRLA